VGNASRWLITVAKFDRAEQAIAMFGPGAEVSDTFLLAPQATRPCGGGYCWSFVRDAKAIHQLIETAFNNYTIDQTKLSLIGYSMGCTMLPVHGSGSSLIKVNRKPWILILLPYILSSLKKFG